ncbi:hypothetical protein V4238_001313 [Pseudomonas aeruginosa]|jgi:hypothetical protein|uniref:hypothetical protein n=1 Tax=Pseudomonas TaxID=286 RepID=UPI000F4E2CCE|nr:MULTISPECIES: hypothetical protein [Pseudomonas]EIU5018591.1 YbjN domain-containing protein [Pseudomonas aeruginosa]EIU5457473.1 YbjN domain-containing protein [Pseudomonas aeruginosa]EIZ7654151.1 hypothetical protein [Pseudomonas aeruginosa]EJZ8928396.1 hypothetical protein [Pseudomonas aeruginosa]EKB9383730.1 hypothetical protein [Pseudomonas aeruginosa]
MSGLAESFSFTPSDWGVSVRDGVAEGIYSLGYGSCHVQIVFEAGDRTEFLDSLPWRFVLPVSEIPDIRQGGFLAHLYDSNSEQDFTAYAFIDPETKMLNIQVNGKDVSSEYPFKWSKGCSLAINFNYMTK